MNFPNNVHTNVLAISQLLWTAHILFICEISGSHGGAAADSVLP
jgi:hypothetical protein